MAMMQKSQSGDLVGIIPYIGIKEFLDKLKVEEYNPDDIYDVWAEMPKDLIENNIKCGVCKEGYTNRPGHIVELPQEVVQNK